MYNLTGSVGKETELPKLTPFEQAEYNLQMFRARALLSDQLDELLKQSEMLERLKVIASAAGSDMVNRHRILTMDREIKSIDIVLQSICEAFGMNEEN
mgnify:CR=1 FL=1